MQDFTRTMALRARERTRARKRARFFTNLYHH